MANYRPLPTMVTIKSSDIEGMGLFSTEAIKEGRNIGMTHYKAHSEDTIPNGWVRTPLGGFINHSETPNTELIGVGRSKYLIALVDIMPEEEITLCYTMYSVNQ